ncbi:MAG: baseplate J/gp47 family protein [Chloroflexota bacterium]|nr:baseplate J/gp47 family protein [Chloroflexota bacterium]
MVDEKILYLSDDDDVTSVRERLKGTEAQKIILVIPKETKLHTNLSWRLLYRDTQDLGKEVHIISPDAHIRDIAREAGFKISPPKKASSPGAGTSPGSTRTSKKASPRLRQSQSRREIATRRSGTPRTPQPPQPAQPSQEIPTIPTITDLPSMAPRKEERGEVDIPSASATFGEKKKQYGPPYNFRVENAPSLHPVHDTSEEDEDDWEQKKYQEAQNFRQSFYANAPDTMVPPERAPFSDQQTEGSQLHEPASQEEPLSTIEDVHQPSTLSEQRARAFVDGVDMHTSLTDISEPPTEIVVEEVREPATFVLHPDDPSLNLLQQDQQDWQQEDQSRQRRRFGQGDQEVFRTYGVPRTARASRGGYRPQPPQSQPADYDSDDELAAPVADQQSQNMSPQPSSVRPQHPSGKLPAAEISGETLAGGQFKVPKAVIMPGTGTRQSKSSAPQQKPVRETRQPQKSRDGAMSPTPLRSMKHPAQEKKKKNGWLPLLIAILLLFLLGVLAYVGPSAAVTVFLPSKGFSEPMKLTANASSTLNAVQQTVPAELLKSDVIRVTGKGQATGSIKVGKNNATGNVVFTNNGTKQVDIPTGTVVTTSKGVQFATTADVVILTAGSNVGNKNVTTIQAVSPGEFGNVPANTIVTIPADSSSKIQQANPGTTINLSVTNTDPTLGGGAGNATAVSSSDVQAEQAVLTKQLHDEVQSWLNKQVHSGDEAGQPVLNEVVTTSPAVGNTAADGSFSETIIAHPTVLVIRASEIQKAAMAQLNEAVSKSKQYQGYAVVQSQPVKVNSLKNTASKDGSSLSLSFTTIGQIVPQHIEQELPGLVAGKSVSSFTKGQKQNGIQHYLISNPDPKADTAYKTLDATITVNPGFWSWVTSLTSRIDVHVVPVPGK